MPDTRAEQIRRLKDDPLDALIIGGGINGAGVLRDLALRSSSGRASLRAGLIEQAHFGSGTSGKNSQLIHGGLRYLKYLQFPLVREALHERSILLRIAPQFVKSLPFLLPMYGWRPRIMYGTGLLFYDLLAGSHAIARRRIIGTREVAEIEPQLNRKNLTAAAVFYDAGVPSARFVVENIMDAIVHGGIAANYVRAESWNRDGGVWRVQCADVLGVDRFELRARKLVDARGAWSGGDALRLVRGSHIVIPRVNASDNAIAHFEPNGRIVFFIPWGSDHQLTLVGTTDEDHREGPDHVRIHAEEMQYLTGVVRKLYPASSGVEPISTFSSLRPLVRADGASATSTSRGHRIWNSPEGILHIAGGKYTTYRLMSEQAADVVCRELAPQLSTLHPTREAVFPDAPAAIGDLMEQRLSDYLYVSTYLGYEQHWDAASLRPLAEALARARGWHESRVQPEVDDIIKGAQPVGA